MPVVMITLIYSKVILITSVNVFVAQVQTNCISHLKKQQQILKINKNCNLLVSEWRHNTWHNDTLHTDTQPKNENAALGL
jgi:hypothetical protein